MQVPDRFDLDDDFIARFGKLSKQHREELIRLLGFPPNPANVPQEFWDKVEAEHRKQLAELLYLIFLLSSDTHGVDEDIPLFDEAVAAEGLRWSSERAGALSQLYVDSTREILDRKLRRRSTEPDREFGPPSFDETLTREDIREDATSLFGKARDESVVNTSITTAQTYGGEFALGMAGLLSDDDLWVNQPLLSATGPCPICEPLHLQPRTVWARIFPEGPPGPHPRCVCIIDYANVPSRA